MGAILLDTTVLIDALRARESCVGRLRRARLAGDLLYTCAINVEETVRGLRPDEVDDAGVLFAGLRIAPLARREGLMAGEWRRQFAQRGKTLSQADCLVASAAWSISARLATGNPRHFPMDGLVIEHWPVGE